MKEPLAWQDEGSQHPSSEQSHTVKCLFYLYFINFNCKKRLNPFYIILPHSAVWQYSGSMVASMAGSIVAGMALWWAVY